MQVLLKDFNNVVSTINGCYHEIALKLGLSDSEFDILYILHDKGNGCNQSVMYKETGMTRSTVNSSIRQLEKKDVLYLQAGVKNNTCVYLTEYGKEFLSSTIEKVVEIENAIFSSWSKEEQTLFIELNKRYAIQLAKKARTITNGNK